MNFRLAAVSTLTLLFVGAVSIAQSKVDQGKPGIQGPWPVTGSIVVGDGGALNVNIVDSGTLNVNVLSIADAGAAFMSDGGVINGRSIGVYPYHCADSSPSLKYLCDAGAQTIGGSVDRLYTVVTNAGDDLGSAGGYVRCRSDGTAPTLDAGAPGQGLDSVGATVSYTNAKGAAIKCICAVGYIGSFECAP
ncbi:MAG: hypothetical protein WAV09_03340 [Minisyncoccia bacterium]